MKTLDEIMEFFDQKKYELAPEKVCKQNFEILKQYAFDDDAVALFYMYSLYNEGSYVEKNADLADKWIDKIINLLNRNDIHTSSKSIFEGDYWEDLCEMLGKKFSNKKDFLKVSLYFMIATAKFDNEDYKTANKYFKKLLEYNVPVAFAFLGMNYYYGYGFKENEDTALKYFEKYFYLVKDKKDPDMYAEATYIVGEIYNNKDNTEKALEFYIKGADLGDSQSQFRAGLILGDNGDYQKAKKYLMKSVENENINALTYAGEFYAYGIRGFDKNTDKAIKYLEKAISLGTNNAKPYVAFCIIYIDKKDYRKAIKYGEYAINKCDFYDEDDINVYISLAISYVELGDYDTALAYASKAKEYNLEDADKYYNDIIKMKRSDKIFGFIDKIFNNPIVDVIPGVNFVAKSYRVGSKIGEAIAKKDSESFAGGVSEFKSLINDDEK